MTSGGKTAALCEAALSYAAKGLAVLPLHNPEANSRCSCGNAACTSIGKHPRTLNGVKDATTDEAIIRDWWDRWPQANIGIATGQISGIVVLDVDPRHGGDVSFKRLIEANGSLPETPMVLTGGNGEHHYLQYPEAKVKNKVNLAPGLDFKADGGYVVAPPSLHASGESYHWEASSHPDDMTPAQMPGWLLKLVSEPGRARNTTEIKNDGRIVTGSRNCTLTSLGGSMRRRGMSEPAILSALLAENEAQCSPPLEEGEVKAIVKSLMGYPAEKRTSFNLTDIGNAERLVALFGGEIRFCHAWLKWLIWSDHRWCIDDTGKINLLAVRTVRTIHAEAAMTEDDTIRKNTANWARQSESKERLKALVEVAKSLPGIPITPDQMDTARMLLNCTNGTLDLITGKLMQHNPGDLITKMVPVEYDPNAECPSWEAFLDKIMGGDYELIRFLQKAVGYSLTGDTSEQVIFILHGTGANGKSTFINTISSLLADYALKTPSETLLAKRHEGVPNDIARLKGARFVSAAESEEDKRLAEAQIKQMTGGDKLTARFMRAEWFEFEPEFKVFIATNHKPEVRGTDLGIWRRIRLVPFNVTIPDHEQDKNLTEKLKTELPGILAWAVEGCLAWQREGLGIPEEVRHATEDYRAEMDVLAGFLEERCVSTISKAKVAVGNLYNEYQDWCQGTGTDSLSLREFNSRLTSRGFCKKKGTTGRIYWQGLGLKTNESGVVEHSGAITDINSFRKKPICKT
ncbi:MAG: DNA primase [Firmicutes bacterium]|nr:DNA primase [Bacillota bacterium]